MRITGVNTFSLQKALGLDEACRLIKEAGFQGMDANLDILFAHDDIMNRRTNPIFDLPEEECIKHFLPWKETAEKYGLTIYQAHCAFPGYFHRCGAYNDYLFSMLEKSVAGCGAIGCSKLIIHPFYNGYEHSLAPEEDFEVNFNRYAALIPAAKKHHVMICLENMFLAFRGKIYSGVCSEMEETCRLVDALNEKAGEKCFGFCLDTGHLLVLGRDVKQAILDLGDRLQALHIHDNNGQADQHLPPYMGVLDWNRFLQGLREIGYPYPLSFEIAFNHFDRELLPSLLRLLRATGDMFACRLRE